MLVTVDDVVTGYLIVASLHQLNLYGVLDTLNGNASALGSLNSHGRYDFISNPLGYAVEVLRKRRGRWDTIRSANGELDSPEDPRASERN
jgi:hypothetical protein